MQCPVDQSELRRSTRQGIEIDRCPTCHGIWLDRGELEKIVARSMDGDSPGTAASDQSTARLLDGTPDAAVREEDGDPARRRTGRRSLLAELFEVE